MVNTQKKLFNLCKVIQNISCYSFLIFFKFRNKQLLINLEIYNMFQQIINQIFKRKFTHTINFINSHLAHFNEIPRSKTFQLLKKKLHVFEIITSIRNYITFTEL